MSSRSQPKDNEDQRNDTSIIACLDGLNLEEADLEFDPRLPVKPEIPVPPKDCDLVPVPAGRIFYKDVYITLQLSRRPITKGHTLLVINGSDEDVLALPLGALLPLMERARAVACHLCRFDTVVSCGLVSDGRNEISVIPLRNEEHIQRADRLQQRDPNIQKKAAAGEKSAGSKDEKGRDYMLFPGYVTSELGSAVPEEVIEDLWHRVTAVSGYRMAARLPAEECTATAGVQVGPSRDAQAGTNAASLGRGSIKSRSPDGEIAATPPGADPAAERDWFTQTIHGVAQRWCIWEDRHHIAYLHERGSSPGFTILVPKDRSSSSSSSSSLAPEPPASEFSLLMAAVQEVADILKAAFDVERCAMIIEEAKGEPWQVKLAPMLPASRRGKGSGKTFFFTDYPGFLTTQIGPKPKDRWLDKQFRNMYQVFYDIHFDLV